MEVFNTEKITNKPNQYSTTCQILPPKSAKQNQKILRLKGGNANTVIEGYFQNVTSIVKDLHEFKDFFESNDFDFIGIAETWLSEHHFDNEFAPVGYDVFRKDRPTRAGGVLLLVNEEFKANRLCIDSDLEIVGASVSFPNFKIIIVVVYLPPPLNRELLDRLDHTLNEISVKNKPNDKMILVGDFNCPNYNPSLQAQTSFLCNKLVNVVSAIGCKQHIGFPTCNNHYLDLIWSNTKIDTALTNPVLPSIHDAIRFSFPSSCQPNVPKNSVKDFNFHKTNSEKCKELLSKVDWKDILPNEIDQNYRNFHSILFEVIEATVPIKQRKRRPYPIYYDSDTIKLIKQKQIFEK